MLNSWNSVNIKSQSAQVQKWLDGMRLQATYMVSGSWSKQGTSLVIV